MTDVRTGAQEVRQSRADPDADLLPVGVIAGDAGGAATFANRHWTALTGQIPEEWAGQGWFNVLEPARRGEARARLLDAIGSGATYSDDWHVIDAGCTRRVLHVTAAPATATTAGPAGFVAVAGDVTAERHRTAALAHAANHDSLTGLYNRSQFLEFVGQAVGRGRRDMHRVAAVLFIDVDGLKVTNDRDGHAAGDRLLQAVGAHITSSVRPGDVVGRYGGDEFTVLCERLRGIGEAHLIADRIRTATGHSVNGDRPCSVSIGVAVAADADAEPQALVDAADEDMYRSRRGDYSRTAGTQSGPTVPGESALDLRRPLLTICGFADSLHRHRGHMSPVEVDDAFAALEAQARRLVELLDG